MAPTVRIANASVIVIVPDSVVDVVSSTIVWGMYRRDRSMIGCAGRIEKYPPRS